jgi:hypothetical protein
VVGAQNFSDSPNVLVTVIVAGLIGLVLLLPIAAELGKHMTGRAADRTEPTTS